MAETSWQQGSPGPLITREVRWFFDGPVPRSVVQWFTDSVHHSYHEQRLDIYDIDAASLGVGIKSRNGGLRDSKILIDSVQSVWLADGVEGCIQDWLKISEPGSDGPITDAGHHLKMVKDIITRDYRLDGGQSGCEVELASVRSGAITGWSFCFETFGEPEEREEALMTGVRQFVVESPIPDCLSLTSENSSSYPEWISRRDFDSMATTIRGA